MPTPHPLIAGEDYSPPARRKPRKALLSLDELDDRLDKGKTRGLKGLKVDWHGACTGTIVKRGAVFAVRIQLQCAKRCWRFTLYVKSGLHNGAFVYTCDRNGKIDGHNLRDEIVRCSPDCKGKRG